jgi:peroxiredoxin Q/BCP
MLKEGKVAPDFTAKDASGREVKLSDFRGSKVALYFYPKDDTPGCTKEACAFRDAFQKLKRAGVKVIGVSPDSSASHEKFASKYQLPFTLISDPDHTVADAYEAYGEKKFMGRTYLGFLRNTFLIDEAGRILRIFKKVKTAEHALEVLAAFKE